MMTLEKVKQYFSPRDMTEGIPWKRILEFSGPMLMGNIAQQLYNTVDAVVVGRSRWGYTALAAVGNAGPILTMLLALFVGIATGVGILTSQYFGAKDRFSLEKTIGNCITMSAIASVVVMIIGPLATGPLLSLMGTLPEVYEYSRDYLVIYFIGISGFFFYNIFSGILRGLGDAFSALLYLVVCSGINIVGDLLLVDPLGVAGVAIATIAAQFISAILCVGKVLSMKNTITITKSTLIPERKYVMSILQLGIPSGLTQVIMSCGNLVVQALVNSFGDAQFVACNVMIMRVDGYAMLPCFTFGQALSTYAGQNIGAGKLDRVITGARQGTIISFICAIFMVPLLIFGGPSLMRLFTPDEPKLVKLAMSMLYVMTPGYLAVSIFQSQQGVIRGAGDTTSPMWINMISNIVVRIPVAYLLVYLVRCTGGAIATQERMVYVSLTVIWVVTFLATEIVYKRGKWKKNVERYLN